MDAQKGIAVTVPNWKNYASRTDIKNHTWFKCSNRILEDEDFFEFTDSEILCWIYVLSLCSQKKSDSVFINFERADRFARRKKEDLISTIKKLERLEILKQSVRDPSGLRTGSVRNPCTTGEYRTGQESTPSVPNGSQSPPSPKKKTKVFGTAEEFRGSLSIPLVEKGVKVFGERLDEEVKLCFEYHSLDEPPTAAKWSQKWLNWISQAKSRKKSNSEQSEPPKVVPSV